MKISAKQKSKIEEIAKKHGIEMVLLFGSAATGRLHLLSDADIALRFKEGKAGLKKFSDVLFDIHGLFGGREIDMVLIDYADPFFLKKIMETAKLVYGNSGQFAELKILAFKKYIDYRKYFQMEKEYVQKFLASKRRIA